MKITRETNPDHGCMECSRAMQVTYVVVFEHSDDPTEVALCYHCIRRLRSTLNDFTFGK